MRRFIAGIFLFLFSFFLKAQTPFAFTIYTISPTTSITCTQSAVNLIAAGNHSALVNYIWQGQSAAYSGSNVSIAVPGIYTVTAFNADIVSSSKVLTVNLNTVAPISFLSAVSQVISCSTAPTGPFSASGNLGINALHQFISPYGGIVSVTAPTANYNPLAPGNYTHVLVNTQTGCKTSKTFTLAIAAPGGFPTFHLQAANGYTLGCGASSMITVSLVNGNTNPPGSTVSYTLIGPQTSTTVISGTLSSSSIYTLNLAGTYTAITKDNTTSCETRVAFTVLQNTAGPRLSIIIPGQVLTCRLPTIQIFAESAEANVSYSWIGQASSSYTFVNNVLATVNMANTQNTVANIYTITAKNDDNQCVTDSTFTIYQNIFPPDALITHQGFPNALTCLSPTIVLSNQSTTGIPPASGYPSNLPVEGALWSGPLPQIPATFSTTYSVFTSGIFTLEALDQNNGCKSYDTIAVFDGKVYPEVNPQGALKFCINSTVTSVPIYPLISGSVTNYNYYWTAPPSTSLSGNVTTPTVNASATGIYTIAVTNTTSGCASIGQVIVANCITDLEENEDYAHQFFVYPNPGNGVFTLTNSKDGKERQVKIYNALGVFIKEQTLVSGENLLDLGNEKNGIFVVRIFEKGIPFYSLKLLKN